MDKIELFPGLCLPSYTTDHSAFLFTVLSWIPIVRASHTNSVACYTCLCMEWSLHMSLASLFSIYTPSLHSHHQFQWVTQNLRIYNTDSEISAGCFCKRKIKDTLEDVYHQRSHLVIFFHKYPTNKTSMKPMCMENTSRNNNYNIFIYLIWDRGIGLWCSSAFTCK